MIKNNFIKQWLHTQARKKILLKENSFEDFFLFLIIGIYMLLVIRRAWMGDDSFITLRTVDNFVNGDGLVYNLSERVQAYTHPLWMFLLSGFYFFTHEPYFTTLAISVVCSSLAVWILSSKVAHSKWAAILGVAMLALSNSFVDYSTSGLENPLTFLLLAIFFAIYFRWEINPRTIFALSFVASLAGFNRLDTMLIYFFPLFFLWLTHKDRIKSLFMGIAGQLPLIFWLLFSFIYYGFPFPNTYYAKLGTGLPASDLLRQGLSYYLNSLEKDPITLLVIFLAITIGLRFIWVKNWKFVSLSSGIITYALYILKIGGDFMSGRFFSSLLFVAVILLTQFDLDNLKDTYRYLTLGIIILVGISAPMPTYQISNENVPTIDIRKIADERLFYSPSTGLINQNIHKEVPFHNFRRIGEQFSLLATSDEQTIFFVPAIGMKGFYAGADAYVADQYGLVDPLRARLPMIYHPDWRLAHFTRLENIEGYIETLEAGENHLKDNGLRTYYDYLSVIIHDPIWNVQRFKIIVNMNLGKFDYLIDEFYYRYPELVTRSYAKINTPLSLPISDCNNKAVTRFKDHGFLINKPERIPGAPQVLIAIQNDLWYKVLFYNNSEVVGKSVVYPTNAIGIKYENLLSPPESVTEYDAIHILPLSKQEQYCLAYVQYIGD